MTEINFKQWNEGIVQEFRANGGQCGGMFAGAPMLIMTTTGSKTGQKHVTPLVYYADGPRYVIFASKAGAPENPAWYNNLVANPVVTLEVGTETFEARATVVTGEERDRLYQAQAARMPQFAEYAAKTSRVIPVIALLRV